ncbi:hypothetical protein Agabi119p4_6143 [Agaricus bisporus var. burnettii]|uniref:Uncharacterized protein n=1 Tax=Agaricus bisporus var. burnettii TaxID=192524 RepID=A0A8H7F1A3_AGABI|nr:hypothetical protein Agabi119p4_6143 [Agaricus bisporus var. burnettii]
MDCAPLDGAVALQESTTLMAGRLTRNKSKPPSHQRPSNEPSAETNTGDHSRGTCQPRVCRRDEYLFGFASNDTLPPLCPRHGPDSYFCPDNGGGCQVANPPGSDCELARDEQCAPPSHSDGQSVCLNQKCMYANATLFSPCVMENTTYTFQASYSRTSHTVSVVRHTCASHTLHCDPSTLTCVTSKKIGEACEADFQCETVTCERGVCYPRADSPNQVPVWQVLITVIAIITAMIVTIFVLIFNHRRRKLKEFRELREYYVEQLILRRTIIAMHTTAIEGGKS